MTAAVAFYKHSGTWVDKLIRLGTNSKYSHTEIVVDEGEGKLSWYSSSPRDSGIRKMYRDIDASRWDIVDIEIDEKHLLSYYNENVGKGYDFLAILFTHILPLGIHDKNKQVCSEFCANLLKITDAHLYSPEDLYRYVS